MPKSCKAIRICDLKDVLGKRELVSLCLGHDLQPVLLSLSGRSDYRILDRIGASFPKLFADKANRFRIHHLVEDLWCEVDLPATTENYHSVQPLPSGRWLLVRGRANSAEDKNAGVFEADGRPVESFHAGDGIEDCQATADGRVWLSFFDEGVYSDVPTGCSGLYACDTGGERVFSYEKWADQAGGISDCYAMNVPDNRNAWICYYTDFPIVHLRDGELEGVWKSNPVSGSHAFAVGDGDVLFAGSYDHRDRLLRVNLGDMSLEELNVTDEADKRLPEFTAIGRGSKLVLSDGYALYEVDARCS